MPRIDEITSELDPPFAVVDLDAFDHNAADLVRRAAGRPIRVATKSVRCRELLGRALRTPGFAGLMCYSLAEALWLHREGLSDDILVAYPTVDRGALRELAADPAAAAAIALVVDSPEHLDLIDDAVGTTRPDIRLCLEVDASWRPLPGLHIGTRRSPVHSADQARRAAATIVRRNGFQLVGVMVYEGQIAGIGDAPAGQPLRAALVRWLQRRSAAELAERRAAVVREVRALAPLEFVNGGGTGSLERTTAEPAVTELAAGSGLIGPSLFDAYRAFQPRPAVQYALPVVHRPAPRIATLFGGGYLASGPPGADRVPVPIRPRGLRLTSTEGAGEVQTPVVGPAADRLRLGDRVWFRHAKAGELAERFTHYHLIDGGRLTTVPTYRGEGRSFG
ncbi:D-serine deaminase, pyridoxal phosphate-dependent [Saccharopolyspora kobensis]|uniref:D-serine deaminase, pyridoxal phosphate-dependent n=1 Tax=Saccharopolyspora kobensis TaxID=146035 RepID=A0A1H6DHK7_9PSEU|nr:amino acid deaminase/aldolase [Saccharopolyspora kobensis]SEG84684.1 D-serine deaminase, pyridoxal phosphate-dependent [Saccharopolyspora kobensis]SFD27097.1 D-serine deaminase, pyridoxal phosphate-dependent [Saccharopolyspora kobensis]